MGFARRNIRNVKGCRPPCYVKKKKEEVKTRNEQSERKSPEREPEGGAPCSRNAKTTKEVEDISVLWGRPAARGKKIRPKLAN